PDPKIFLCPHHADRTGKHYGDRQQASEYITDILHGLSCWNSAHLNYPQFHMKGRPRARGLGGWSIISAKKIELPNRKYHEPCRRVPYLQGLCFRQLQAARAASSVLWSRKL